MDTIVNIQDLRSLAEGWKPTALTEAVPQGDMPGDRIRIGAEHIKKANAVFPELLRLLAPLLQRSPCRRAVVGVCGGSGVGKSETASVLAHYFRQEGLGCYTLSGDNYPRRIPRHNDAERLRIFRQGGLRGLIAEGLYDAELSSALRALQARERDAGPLPAGELPWLPTYQRAGKRALAAYLGTSAEIDFAELNGILAAFKRGDGRLWLKRMGRDDAALWYEQVSFGNISLLLLEWTHANSAYLRGVDIPVFLFSTPQETLAHRQARNRDGASDSPFTEMVLCIEQEQLMSRAARAKIIVGKNGEPLSRSELRRLRAGGWG